MNDWLPAQVLQHQYIIDQVTRIARLYGYQHVETPILEATDVFSRPLGEDSDVVGKEMYSFADRNGTSITLRPELTAGMVRAALSRMNSSPMPFRWIHAGPAFRHERPQKGRFRQFTQVSVEHMGTPDPSADVECILIAWRVIKDLGLAQRIRVDLNSLGAPSTRIRYRDELRSYLLPHRDDLSPESQARLDRNPLRILDSRNTNDRSICQSAPRFSDFWDNEDRDFYARVTRGLNEAKIPWKDQPMLVRGLDYYCHTVFEFCSDELGAQDAVLSGGRYDGLGALLQYGNVNRPTPLAGVGWAMGVERLANLVAAPKTDHPRVAIFPLGTNQESAAQHLGETLRTHKIACIMRAPLGLADEPVSRKRLGRAFSQAECLGAEWGIIIGSEEEERGVWTLRHFKSQENRSYSCISTMLSCFDEHMPTDHSGTS